MSPELINPDLAASDKFEVYRHPTKGWYAQHHCTCGSTLSSGMFMGNSSALKALADCLNSCNQHWAQHKHKPQE